MKARRAQGDIFLQSSHFTDGATEAQRWGLIPQLLSQWWQNRIPQYPDLVTPSHTQCLCWAGLKGLLRWLYSTFWLQEQRESNASTKKELAVEEQWRFNQEPKYQVIRNWANFSPSTTTQTFIYISELSPKRFEVIGNRGYCFILLVPSLMISAKKQRNYNCEGPEEDALT